MKTTNPEELQECLRDIENNILNSILSPLSDSSKIFIINRVYEKLYLSIKKDINQAEYELDLKKENLSAFNYQPKVTKHD